MAQKKVTAIEITRLAQDLKLGAKSDPWDAIIKYCEKRIQKICADKSCESLSDLLRWVAEDVGTIFREIRNNKELEDIKSEYCSRGEKIFANVENELSDEQSFGITYQLQHQEVFENPHVSIIDCRGAKLARSYFTKWHEIAHLLTLTDQMRLVFRRTHSSSVSGANPEERLMDAIAGKVGFYDGIFHKHIKEEISFGEIERLRSILCPDASQQASQINFIKNWSAPCIHITIGLGLKREEEESLKQGSFFFVDPPTKVLRALRTEPNDKAREIDFRLFTNMRIPENSIISKVYSENLPYAEAVEAEWQWEFPVKVKVRNYNGSIDALIILA